MRLVNISLMSFLVVFFLGMALSLSAKAQFGAGLGPGFGPFPVDPDHIPKNPYEKNYIRVSGCELKANGKSYQLHAPPNSLDEVFEILNLTATGKKLIAAYEKQNSETPHKLTQLNTYVRQQNNFPVKIGAVYMFNENGRTIFYDPQDDLGLLTVFFSHELMHAIDPEVPPAYFEEIEAYKNKSKQEFEAVHAANAFRIERRAFDMQDKVLPELLSLTSCYEKFIQEHRDRNGLKLFLPTPDSYIRDSYNLN